MNTGVQLPLGLRYKLRMIRVPVLGRLYIYWNIMYATHNTSKNKYVLKHKSNSILYHSIQKSFAMGEPLCGNILSEENMLDLCIKTMRGWKKRNGII